MKYSIDDMRLIAAERGGLCLSPQYLGSDKKLIWQCSEGHIWNAIVNNIKKGSWCPYCSRRAPLTIEDMQNLAIEKGGKCLSTEYNGALIKLIWQCNENHIWEASPNNIKNNNTWCPHCSGLFPLTIFNMHELAAERNGKCLSKIYINSRTKLEWQCFEKHTWQAHPNSIKSGSWCPYCNINYNEEFCREYLKFIFNNEFIRCRPSWLKNPQTNYTLELDGYCAQLNLAFEYNGEQHYYPVKFGLNISDEEAKIELVYRQKSDKIKLQLCKENNIKLIIIPYWENENIEKFILSELKRLNIVIPNKLNLDRTNKI